MDQIEARTEWERCRHDMLQVIQLKQGLIEIALNGANDECGGYDQITHDYVAHVAEACYLITAVEELDRRLLKDMTRMLECAAFKLGGDYSSLLTSLHAAERADTRRPFRHYENANVNIK
jgi:hypothetical protein